MRTLRQLQMPGTSIETGFHNVRIEDAICTLFLPVSQSEQEIEDIFQLLVRHYLDFGAVENILLVVGTLQESHDR
jgi:hypothetical protein